jgi:hypothetical protein
LPLNKFQFQFQFAGVDFSRPSLPHRKWLRIGIMVFAGLLAGLAYWGYLHHVNHHARPVVPVSYAVPPAVVAATPKPAVAVAATVLAKEAGTKIMAVGNVLVEAVEKASAKATATVAPPVSVASAEPVAKPVTAPMAVPVVAPVVMAAPKPVMPRPVRVHTDQERLLMAGQTAFGNMIETANKYPDAYGFQAGDFLSDAKLGEPLPVYTIEESARASYQPGQPVKPLLKPAKQWVFPVLMGDRVCCMVEVKQAGHDYVPGKGNKSLAMAWRKIQQKWPAEAGFHPLLLVNPAVPGFYFTVPELPVQNITDTVEMFYFNPGTSPADVILASWR